MLNEHLLVRNVDVMGNAMDIRTLCVTSLNKRVPRRVFVLIGLFIGIRFLANIAQKESETAQPDMKSTLVKTILIQFPLVVFKEGEGLLPAYPMLNILIFPLFYPWVARSAYF